MAEHGRDHSLDTLLALDGQTFFIDGEGRFWVRFEVRRCDVSTERPHGLRYSLTLHDEAGDRLVGFDNAHPADVTRGPARRSMQKHDHKHRFRTVRPYDYKDAATLLADFWSEVDAILQELGARR
jgi:hypothetical protein